MCTQSPAISLINRDNGKFDISTSPNGDNDDGCSQSPVFSLLETVQIQEKNFDQKAV